MATQQTLLFANRGSIPTSPHQFKIMEGKFSDFAVLLEKYHYKSSKIGGGINWHLILKYNGKIYGGMVIGQMRHMDKYEEKAVELRRMVLHPDCPKNTASYFLSKTMWWLKKYTCVSTVYSFADQTVGHKGTCYKASNFEYVKKTSPTIHVLWQNKRYHPRSLSIERPYSHEIRKAVKNGDAKIIKGKPKLLFKYIINRKLGEIPLKYKEISNLYHFIENDQNQGLAGAQNHADCRMADRL